MNLESLRGWMKGEDAVVVGCGPSADEAWAQAVLMGESRWTLACKRAVVTAHPDFAVCVEPAKDGLWGLIKKHAPLIVFSNLCDSKRYPSPCPRLVDLGGNNVIEWLLPCETCSNTGRVDGGQGKMIPCPDCHGREPLSLGQSPFFAIAAAILMGFETIGVIGVDLSKDRYGDAHRPNAKYGKLAEIALQMGSRVVNLSQSSQLTAIPQGSWEEIRRKNHDDTDRRAETDISRGVSASVQEHQD